MADGRQLEWRTVEVELPGLTGDANQRLTDTVRDVIGTDRVEVPADRPRTSRGEKPHIAWYNDMNFFKAGSVGSVAVAVGVGLIILLTTSHWWLLAIAVVVLLIALAFVTRTIIGLASVTEYSDPFLAALLSEQGVRDPDMLFTELVSEFTPMPDGEHRTTAVEDDPARAVAEQKESITPGGGPSTAVGPGDE